MLERILGSVAEVKELALQWPMIWINVDGLGDEDAINQLGQLFSIHPLALEDVRHVNQRPKLEHYPDQLFLVTRLVHELDQITTEQLSIVMGRNFLITFQESDMLGDCFESVRARLRRDNGTLRSLPADSLLYSILDSVVDSYFPVLERYGERFDEVEELILENRGSTPVVTVIHDLKRDLLVLRRVAWPLREVFNTLLRDTSPLIRDETRIYFRDCYDHIVRIIDLIETDRELAADLMDFYMSAVSNRMNDIMRVLTVISTIFIPLNFIAGIYGMNFKTEASPLNMPELSWHYGYPFALTMMATVAVLLLGFFYRRGWLGGKYGSANETLRTTTTSAQSAAQLNRPATAK